MNRRKEIGIFIGLFLTFAVLIFAAMLLLGSAIEQKKAVDWVGHTRNVLEQIHALVAHLTEAENDRRGFVLSGREAYVDMHTNRVELADSALKELRRLTSDNPRQVSLTDQLEETIRRRLTISTNSIHA